MFKRMSTFFVVSFLFASAGTACGATDLSENEWSCGESGEFCEESEDVGAGESHSDTGTAMTDAVDDTGTADTPAETVDTAGERDTGSRDADAGDTQEDTDGGRLVREGTVDIVQERRESVQPGPAVSMRAEFRVVDPSKSLHRPCRTERTDACRVEICEHRSRHGDPGTERVSAGELKIGSGNAEVVLTPNTRTAYAETREEPLWEELAPVSVEALGGEVEPFSVSLETSTGVTVERPDFPGAFESMEVPVSEDFRIKWRAGDFSPTKFFAEFHGFTTDDERVTLTCAWPVRRQQATIPASLLSKFPAETNAAYEFGVGSRRRIETGAFDVTVRAIDIAGDGESGTWNGRGSARFVE